MKLRKLPLLAAAGLLTAPLPAQDNSAKSDPLAWPPITKENKPATRWWWMGSAVNADDLTRELKTFHEAGLGSVEITPIYGVKGSENQFIDYLSPKWMEMLKTTVSEAQKLDMNVDMVTGTGWCFGGPNVGDQDANALAVVKTFDVNPGATLGVKVGSAQALVAFSSKGECIDLTEKTAQDGSVNWTPPAGSDAPWRVYQISQKPSGVKVKRPAPGGAGWMLNLLQPDAMPRYLERFTDAFSKYDGPKPHGQFHDSYEYKSDWSPDFFAQFEKRRGYKLQTELPALFENKGDADHIARVKTDYRETVSELIEESIARWTKWTHDQGSVSRNQAHGSPGNWLDIYAASDIPETEMFNKDRDILVSKFASSAAHVTGKNLVGAEAGTWVAEHFTEKLSDLKYLFDDLFLSGVNRITYHGTAYSPADAPWPGWCFYASTEMNPRNAIWHDVPALNAYIARVQSILQSGRPDNDILLYWPIHDFWHNEKSDKGSLAQQLTVHARDWFGEQPIGKTARMLYRENFMFDYVSDKQLQNVKVDTGGLDLFGNKYRVIFIPECEHMPIGTMEKLLSLVSEGATVVFENHFPHDVPGAGDLELRRSKFQQQAKSIQWGPKNESGSAIGSLGAGHVRIDTDYSDVFSGFMSRDHIVPPLTGGPFHFKYVRRKHEGFSSYFIVNHDDDSGDLTSTIYINQSSVASIAVLDPMTGRSKLVEGKSVSNPSYPNQTQFDLELKPRESLILLVWDKEKIPGKLVRPFEPIGDPVPLHGKWNVQFIDGGPTLPKEFSTEKLGSWTELGGEEAQSFAGTARYTLHFDAPNEGSEPNETKKPNEKPEHWSLDLGKVAASARVKLNGKDLGTVFIPPFRVPVEEALKPKDNVLEVEVTNTSANRIRDLDRRKVEWKKFYDINIVNMDYKPFDASNWPLTDSGLLGPVTLTPEKAAP